MITSAETENSLDFQFETLALAAGFVSQSQLGIFRANILGAEAFNVLNTAVLFGLGYQITQISQSRWPRFFRWRLGLASCVSIAILTFVSYPLARAGAAHNWFFPIYGFAGLIGAVSGLASDSNVAMAGGLRRWLGAGTLALVGCWAVGHSISTFGYLKTAEITGATILVFTFLISFWHGRRNGWIAFAFFLIASIPFVFDKYWKNSPVEMTSQVGDQRIAVLETESDPKYPGITQHTLFANGVERFASAEEQSYYNCLVNIPDAAAQLAGHPATNALIIGGGSGLVARNLVNVPRIKTITVVDPDPILEISRSELKLRIYNLDSLKSPKVDAIAADPFTWVARNIDTFDLILLDWPVLEPRNTAKRYFSAEFLSRLLKHLSPEGWISISVGPANPPGLSTTYAHTATSMKRTLIALGLNAHLYVDSKSNSAFVLGTQDSDFEMKLLAQRASMLAIVTKSKRQHPHPPAPLPVCYWPADWKHQESLPNTLSRNRIARDTASHMDYRGPRAALLPD